MNPKRILFDLDKTPLNTIAVGWSYSGMRSIESLTVVESPEKLQKLLLP